MASFNSDGIGIRIDQQEPTTAGRHPAIVLLHGSGGNVDFWFGRIAPRLAHMSVGLYAVHYFDRTGTVRAGRETILDGFHFPTWMSTISDSLAYVRSRPTVDPDRIALLGISLGAFLSLALAADQSAAVRAVIEISGGIPETFAGHVSSAFPPTLIVHGDADTVVPPTMAHQLGSLLKKLGVDHRSLILPGEGHWFSTQAQLQILIATVGFLSGHL